MRQPGGDERGLSLIELLVTMALFAVLAVGFYQVMFSQVRATDTTQSVASISQEARLGFNRMVRDTREGTLLTDGTDCDNSEMMDGECFRVRVDFNGDGDFDNPSVPEGDYEDITFRYSPAMGTVTISAGGITDVLMTGVTPLDGADGIFEFSSNLLRYDTNGDGVASWEEIDAAPGDVGNGNNSLDVGEFDFLSSVTFGLQVEVDGEESEFYSHAQLRNRRFGFE